MKLNGRVGEENLHDGVRHDAVAGKKVDVYARVSTDSKERQV